MTRNKQPLSGSETLFDLDVATSIGGTYMWQERVNDPAVYRRTLGVTHFIL